MLIFIIKKMFFDMWDNLLTIILLNIGLLLFIGVIMLPIPLFQSLPPVAFYFYIIMALILFNLLIGITTGYTNDIADYKKPGLKDCITYLRNTWKYSLMHSLFLIILIIIINMVIPFYFSRDAMFYWFIGGIIIWITLTAILTSLYFLPLSIRINKGLKKNIRNCFLLLFDNTGFTWYIVLISTLILSISFFTLFLLPGLATVTLWINVCIKIRLYKYDYLDANPEANRKKIPWKELTLEDEKKVGKRTLRGMIFPWKE